MTQDAAVVNPSCDPLGDDPPGKAAFPVVCIGMSTGGLGALRTIFERLSPTTGMAYVVVSHLSRTQPTWLPWLLSRWSQMPCELVKPGLVFKPNHIYVIPPGQEITAQDGYFGIRPRSKAGWSNVVTLFLQSLTSERTPPGVAVILSGVDADGAAALQEFRRQGGITIAQDLSSSDHPDMPKSAIDTGAVDHVLSPGEMAAKLEEIGRQFYTKPE